MTFGSISKHLNKLLLTFFTQSYYHIAIPILLVIYIRELDWFY